MGLFMDWQATLANIFAGYVNQQTLEDGADQMVFVSSDHPECHRQFVDAIRQGLAACEKHDPTITEIINRSGYGATTTVEANQLLTELEEIYLAKYRLAADPQSHHEIPTMTQDQLQKLWADHLAGEFTTKDVEYTLSTMVDDASVNHMPVNTGGKGKAELRAFYRDVFIPSWPDDLVMTPTNRVMGDSQLVDELHLRFTHSKRMDWFLPGVPPTNKLIEVDMVVVVQFRGDKLACERIYWDHAGVLQQVGLLNGGSPGFRDVPGRPV